MGPTYEAMKDLKNNYPNIVLVLQAPTSPSHKQDGWTGGGLVVARSRVLSRVLAVEWQPVGGGG